MVKKKKKRKKKKRKKKKNKNEATISKCEVVANPNPI
jgi:hypothetical protein